MDRILLLCLACLSLATVAKAEMYGIDLSDESNGGGPQLVSVSMGFSGIDVKPVGDALPSHTAHTSQATAADVNRGIFYFIATPVTTKSDNNMRGSIDDGNNKNHTLVGLSTCNGNVVSEVTLPYAAEQEVQWNVVVDSTSGVVYLSGRDTHPYNDTMMKTVWAIDEPTKESAKLREIASIEVAGNQVFFSNGAVDEKRQILYLADESPVPDECMGVALFALDISKSKSSAKVLKRICSNPVAMDSVGYDRSSEKMVGICTDVGDWGAYYQSACTFTGTDEPTVMKKITDDMAGGQIFTVDSDHGVMFSIFHSPSKLTAISTKTGEEVTAVLYDRFLLLQYFDEKKQRVCEA